MPRGQDNNEQFEWVNAWAASTTPGLVHAAPEAVVSVASSEVPDTAPLPQTIVRTTPDDQLARDIAEIARARDVLAGLPVGTFSARRTQALTLVPSRTSDSVPVFVGGVLALVMLTVFGAAAAMTKLSR
ncbi:MAG: hypothetical protein E6G97_07320 [Alphaproteobacteria bacterium]|nr:MAG: hypothetical protein E6G97_07320 [Alphaproteobacteria bacterium]